nr:hypothetical protein B0A51_09140 [Rachicladosporium sp. CCFEE 5018]
MVGLADSSDHDFPSTPPRPEDSSFYPDSTTPSQPPPAWASHVSTTPLGPPPRSSFNPGNTFSRGRGTPLKSFALPESSPLREDGQDAEPDVDMDETFMSKAPAMRRTTLASSLNSSVRGLKRSRSGKPQPRQDSSIPTIAKGLAKQARPARLFEPDTLIIASEEVIGGLESQTQDAGAQDGLESALAKGCSSLAGAWVSAAAPSTKEASVGPAKDEALANASYIGSLMLQLHHPHSAKAHRLNADGRYGRKSLLPASPTHATTLPRALLDWLNTHHNPFPDDYNDIHLHQPAPSDSDSFWDVVYATALRGKFERTIRLLKDAGWEHAVTALDDGSEDPGYRGKQLDNTRLMVARCTSILEACPALTDGDWDIKGQAWSLCRQRLSRAVRELEEFAEGEGQEPEPPQRDNIFAASAGDFGGTMSLSAASKRAESKVPFTIVTNLKTLYGQIMGKIDEVILPSQDWLEASMYLTIWWDGEEDGPPPAALGRSAMRKSIAQGQRAREIDVTPLTAYRRRLADAVALVTDDPEDPVFQVDTTRPVHVALACVMEDNIEGTLAIMRSWSIVITAAVTEMAAFGGWLPQARPRSKELQRGFSSEDLMVLSHGPGAAQPSGDVTRDAILTEYADLLAEKEMLTNRAGLVKEGWELAVAVLGRLDDTATAQRRIGQLLGEIDIADDERAEKVLSLCSDLGLADESRVIAERYADTLASTSQSFGPALLFYARAYATAKLTSTLWHLSSLSLLHSTAIPSPSTLDATLSGLLFPPRPALSRLATQDPSAATLLSKALSGYATLRVFYALRDYDFLPPTSPERSAESSRPQARQRSAAAILIAALSSAADSIRGGLFDPSVQSAISYDAILVLLAETLPFFAASSVSAKGNKGARIFTQDHLFTLLRVVEDFTSSPSRIQEGAEALLKATIDAYTTHSNSKMTRSRSNLLGKSRSDLSSNAGLGGSYDMLRESYMMVSQDSSLGGKGKVGAGEVERGWDWRKGVRGAGGVDLRGEDVVGMVRLGIAESMGRVWGGR